MSNAMEPAEAVKFLESVRTKIQTGQIVGKEALDAVVTDLRSAMKKDRENSANLAQNRVQSSDDRKLSKYLPLDDDDVEQARKSFYVNKGENNRSIQVKGALYKGGAYVPGLLDDLNPVCDWQRELQRLATQKTVISFALGRPGVKGDTPITDREIRRHMRQAPDLVSKIFNDTANEGAEWIDDGVLPGVERRLELDRRLESIFMTQTVGAMGSLRIPFQTTGLRPYKASANTSNDPGQYTASDIVTDERVYTPVKIAARTVVDEDATEDAFIAVMPWLTSEISKAITDGKEDAIINGDTAAPHQDDIGNWNTRERWGSTGLGGSGDHRRLWTGLRARAFDVANVTDQSGAQSAAGLRKAMAKLLVPQFLGEAVIVASPEYLISVMFGFPQVETLDKLGAAATILSGQLATLYGWPIILSEFMTADLEDSGLFLNSGSKNKTSMLVLNRTRFKMFTKRGTSVKLQSDITRGAVNIVGTERTLFETVDPLTTKNVHLSRNLDFS